MKKPKSPGRKPISGRERVRVMRWLAGDYFDFGDFMPSRPLLPGQTRQQWVELHWKSFRWDAQRYFFISGRC